MTRFFAKPAAAIAAFAFATAALTGCGESLVGPEAPETSAPATRVADAPAPPTTDNMCAMHYGGGSGNCEYPW